MTLPPRQARLDSNRLSVGTLAAVHPNLGRNIPAVLHRHHRPAHRHGARSRNGLMGQHHPTAVARSGGCLVVLRSSWQSRSQW